jgi:hypothetical protein
VKLDGFKGFEDFDRGAMADAIRQELSQEEGASPQASRPGRPPARP